MSKRQTPTQPDYIKWLLLLGAATLVVLGGAYLFWHYVLPHSVNVDRYRYPVAGIDVSKHNGEIDFEKVADDDYQFVFIKASEGKTYQDEAFERNYQGARDAGLKVGAYHFFRKNRTGEEQAANLLNVVKGKEITKEGVVIADSNGSVQTLPCDQIVIAAGRDPYKPWASVSDDFDNVNMTVALSRA